MIFSKDVEMMVMERPWLKSRYSPGICLEELRETIINMSQDCLCCSQDFNFDPNVL
jgi:hypothetical protein